jgi:hypothetical protein
MTTMPTLDKRITELERAMPDEQWLLALVPDQDGIYKPVPDGFRGKIQWVVFVDTVQVVS